MVLKLKGVEGMYEVQGVYEVPVKSGRKWEWDEEKKRLFEMQASNLAPKPMWNYK